MRSGAKFVVGVSRGESFSPNHVGNDAAIFKCVMDELRRSGFIVESYTESSFVALPIYTEPVIVVSMARDSVTLDRLKEWETTGHRVVNSPYGVANCTRKSMTEILVNHDISHPHSWIIDLNKAISSMGNLSAFDNDLRLGRDSVFSYLSEKLTFPCWVKRGDSHAMVREDVSYADCKEQVSEILHDFVRRGIGSAVINEHLKGDLVKFYGVKDTPFFYNFYPSSAMHSKFGLETINGLPQGHAFDVNELRNQANRAASVLNVPIYGGDAIVEEGGTIRIIDFNDWPSFAPCREDAACAIAAYIRSIE